MLDILSITQSEQVIWQQVGNSRAWLELRYASSRGQSALGLYSQSALFLAVARVLIVRAVADCPSPLLINHLAGMYSHRIRRSVSLPTQTHQAA